LIYRLFLEGKAFIAIAKHLTESGIPTPAGKTVWHCGVVESILTNVIYKGDAVLQKTFTTNFLAKKMKINEGEVPQYYVERSHDAIIYSDEFDLVQIGMARRKALDRSYRGMNCFSSRIVCGDCGSFFGSKVWHSTSKYHRTILQCNNKFKSRDLCSMTHITEDEIKERFISALNSMLEVKSEVIENCKLAIDALCDLTIIEAELAQWNSEAQVLTELTRKHIEENASSAQSQDTYGARYNDLLMKYNAASTRIAELNEAREHRRSQQIVLTAFTDTIEKSERVYETFDEGLWQTIVQKATVHSDGRIVFTFSNGQEIER